MKTFIHDIFNKGTPIVEKNQETVNQILQRSQNVLLYISAVFPLDPFPDTLIVDQSKITILHRNFIGFEHIHSILIEDVTDVTVDTGPFFATIYITDSNNPRFPKIISVSHLKRRDARRARNIIQGLLAAKREGVEFVEGMDLSQITQSIERIGKSNREFASPAFR